MLPSKLSTQQGELMGLLIWELQDRFCCLCDHFQWTDLPKCSGTLASRGWFWGNLFPASCHNNLFKERISALDFGFSNKISFQILIEYLVVAPFGCQQIHLGFWFCPPPLKAVPAGVQFQRSSNTVRSCLLAADTPVYWLAGPWLGTDKPGWRVYLLCQWCSHTLGSQSCSKTAN